MGFVIISVLKIRYNSSVVTWPLFYFFLLAKLIVIV